MAVNLSPMGGVAAQFFDNNGVILSGGKIYTYAAGTTTNQATYTSAAGTTAHTNPIILDSAGRVPNGEIWLTDGLQYKFVIKNASDVLINTYDNIIGINSNFVNFVTETEIQTATAGQTVFTLTTMQYQPGTNNLSVFVDGVNQYDGVSYNYVETDATTVTFTAGLHVGALVKFTTAQTLSTGVTDASLVTYDPPFTGSVTTNVEDKLAQYVSVMDFGAVGDGVADDTAAVQAAIDYCIANDCDLYVPSVCKLTSTVNINREVDDATKAFWFGIFSGGSGGFVVDTAIDMFGSTLPYANGPNTQLINFQGIQFKSTNASLSAYVLDGSKFLRTMFNDCSFESIKCLTESSTYVQSIYLYGCNARYWEGSFFFANEAYNIEVIGGLYEQGGSGFNIRSLRQGKFWTIIEGLDTAALILSGMGIDICCYFEFNGGADIDFTAHSGVASRGVNVHGCWTYRSTASASIYWGACSGCVAQGNYQDGVAGSSLHNLTSSSYVEINDFSEQTLSNQDAIWNSGYRAGNCPLTITGVNNSNISFGAQSSTYRKIGKQVFVDFIGTLTIPAPTGAADALVISGGFPYQPESGGYLAGQLEVVGSSSNNGISPLYFAINTGFLSSLLVIPVMPSGGTYTLRGQLSYRVEKH